MEKEAHAVLDEGFAKFQLRLVELRTTPMKFIKEHTALSYQTYWRNRDSKSHYCSAINPRVMTLGKLEEALRSYEEKLKEGVE
jgi:hypothetical protein